MDKDGLLRAILNSYVDGEHNDIDGWSMQEWLVEFGFAENSTVTEQDHDNQKFTDYGVGDQIVRYTPEMMALLKEPQP